MLGFVGGDGRYRSEADEVFYGQFVEDQKQDINREIQQREGLHGWWEEGGGDQLMSTPSPVDKRGGISTYIFQMRRKKGKVAEWRGRSLLCSLTEHKAIPLGLRTKQPAIYPPAINILPPTKNSKRSGRLTGNGDCRDRPRPMTTGLVQLGRRQAKRVEGFGLRPLCCLLP